jgi:crotonobetainyl-CoA:carnitine CoA-transferase CaiB-like acyl-CoA transferase
MKGMSSEEAQRILEEAEVPSGPIYSVADMFNDEHYQARGLFEQVESNGSPLTIPAMIPKMSDTPGGTRWPGPPLGAHNEEILGDLLGMDAAQLQALKKAGNI